MALESKQVTMARNTTKLSAFKTSAGMKQDTGKGEDVPEHSEQTTTMLGSTKQPVYGTQKLTKFDESLNNPSIPVKRSMP